MMPIACSQSMGAAVAVFAKQSELGWGDGLSERIIGTF